MQPQTFLRLRKIKALIARLDRQYLKMRSTERKVDARRKIQLGGLVIKAGLESETTATILGLLLDAAEKLQDKNCDRVRRDFKIKGDIALTHEQAEKGF